jgi:adenosine deaminase
MEGGLSFEQFLTAINDGRDRVQRGWNVQLAWILTIPRDQPRKADDFIRWAMSAAAKKGGVVGLGLSGPENVQPVGQFERPFHSAEKKGLPRLPLAGDALGAQGLQETVQLLLPDRIFHGWGAAESPELLRLLEEQHVPLCLTLTHELRMERIKSYADYPLRKLLDEGVIVTLSSGMPELYKTTLAQEYLAAVGQCGVYPEELETLALNSVRMSVMPEAQKQKMLEQFAQEYARLRSEHLTPETT